MAHTETRRKAVALKTAIEWEADRPAATVLSAFILLLHRKIPAGGEEDWRRGAPRPNRRECVSWVVRCLRYDCLHERKGRKVARKALTKFLRRRVNKMVRCGANTNSLKAPSSANHGLAFQQSSRFPGYSFGESPEQTPSNLKSGVLRAATLAVGDPNADLRQPVA